MCLRQVVSSTGSSPMTRRATARTHSIALLLTIIAACIPAQAAMEPVKCPVWDYTYPSPEKAAEAKANNYSWYGAGSTCKPIAIVNCTPFASGPADYMCDGVWADTYPRCPLTPPQVYAGGSGFPVAGNTIYRNGIAGLNHCVVFNDDSNKDKGGPPPCNNGSACGNVAGNPINVASANKFQREVDVPATGGLSFERFYNSAMPLAQERTGVGWSHSWSRSLHFFLAAGRIRVVREDGKSYLFRLSGSA